MSFGQEIWQRKWMIIVSVFILASFFCFQVKAQSEDPLVFELKGFLVTEVADDKGAVKEIIKPLPDKVLPGSVIQYEIIAKNTKECCPDKNTLKSVNLTGIIPMGTVYIDKSATAEYSVEFSIDGGGTFQKEPVKYKVKLPDGKEVEKIATPDMYTNIRWVVPEIKPQQEIKVFYRIIIKEKEIK